MTLATMQAARNILRSLRQTYSSEPRTRVPADEAQFRHLDLAGYQRFGADMEARGYRRLADYAIVEMNRARGGLLAPTFLRVMLSADGTAVCAYCQIKQRLGKRLWLLFQELMDGRGKAAWEDFRRAREIQHNVSASTDFADGRSVCVTTGEGASQFSRPPTLEMHHFAQGTALDTLLAALAERVGRLRTEPPEAQPVAISTVEELYQLQDRAAAQKLAYRQSVGWITRDELLAMVNGNAALADALHAEIQKQLAEEAEA